jgi:exodeoxyribonuclease VII small subunit
LSPNQPDAGSGVADALRGGEASAHFEVSFADLQRVVTELESGGLDLERALALFARGTELVRSCERIVDAAELRVTRLTAESASPLADASVDADP